MARAPCPLQREDYANRTAKIHRNSPHGDVRALRGYSRKDGIRWLTTNANLPVRSHRLKLRDPVTPSATAVTPTQRLTLAATGLGLFMIFLDALIVNVGLPAIQAEFRVGEAGLQWVVTAYSLGMAVFIMSAATLADLHGRRRLYVAGVVLFTAASIACGLAP